MTCRQRRPWSERPLAGRVPRVAVAAIALALVSPARAADDEAEEGGSGEQEQQDAKKRAAEALVRGTKLFKQGEYEQALAEFRRSRGLYPARGNTLNAALALRELGRYDEALDLFETLLRDYPDIPDREREQVERALTSLRVRPTAPTIRWMMRMTCASLANLTLESSNRPFFSM